MSETILRSLKISDLADVARVHQLAFPDSALTHLGLEAVKRYYKWQLSGPHDVLALGAFQGGDLVGFCFGGVFRGALSGFVRKNKGYLLVKVLSHPWLVFQAEFRSRLKLGLVASGFLKNKRQMSDQFVSRGNSFGILSIAVSPQSQGTGVGKKLMGACETSAFNNKFERMSLTVQTQNQQAIRFYSALGWKKAPPDSEWRGQMYKNLKDAQRELLS